MSDSEKALPVHERSLEERQTFADVRIKEFELSMSGTTSGPSVVEELKTAAQAIGMDEQKVDMNDLEGTLERYKKAVNTFYKLEQ